MRVIFRGGAVAALAAEGLSAHPATPPKLANCKKERRLIGPPLIQSSIPLSGILGDGDEGAVREALVASIKNAHRAMIRGFAACYAGWLCLPGRSPNTRPYPHRAGG